VVVPKAMLLRYDKQELTLNQGFNVYCESDKEFNIEVDEVFIDGLTNDQYVPSFKKSIYSTNTNEAMTLEFLNSVNNIPEKIYKGYYTYKKSQKKSEYLFTGYSKQS
jgi:hypothetical protein